MDPGVLNEWVEKIRQNSPSIRVGVHHHSITIEAPNGEHIRFMVTDSTFKGLGNIVDAARVAGTAIQRGIDRIAAEELKRREAINQEFGRVSNAGTPAMPADDKVVSIHSKWPPRPRLPVF